VTVPDQGSALEPPQIREVIPEGIWPEPGAVNPVPYNSSVAVLIESSEGIDTRDPLSVSFVIDDGVNRYTRYLNDTNAKGRKIVRAVPLDGRGDVSNFLWVVYYRSNEPKAGDVAGMPPVPPEYPFGATAQVSVNVADIKKQVVLTENVTLLIEDEQERQVTLSLLPEMAVSEDSPAAGYTIYEVTFPDEPQGAAIIYDNVLPDETGIVPYVGPSEDIPPLDVPGTEAVGTQINLQPPTVFPRGVTVRIPCPGYSSADEVKTLTIYYYNGTGWVPACDGEGNVLPGGLGWMVPGSREDYDSYVEIGVYHFSAVITGTTSGTTVAVGSSGGGGGGGCFIGSLFENQ
jgi:hypothetical protein